MTGSLGALASHDAPPCPAWLTVLAGVVPLAYYVATASAHGFWYEEAALVGTSAELGVSYPPGAPLVSLMSAAPEAVFCGF